MLVVFLLYRSLNLTRISFRTPNFLVKRILRTCWVISNRCFLVGFLINWRLNSLVERTLSRLIKRSSTFAVRIVAFDSWMRSSEWWRVRWRVFWILLLVWAGRSSTSRNCVRVVWTLHEGTRTVAGRNHVCRRWDPLRLFSIRRIQNCTVVAGTYSGHRRLNIVRGRIGTLIFSIGSASFDRTGHILAVNWRCWTSNAHSGRSLLPNWIHVDRWRILGRS